MKTVILQLIPSRPRSTVSIGLFLIATLICCATATSFAQGKITIAANGGGNGPLADTLPAITISGLADIDFIELNLAVTSDDELIIFPRNDLGNLTNVDQLFPDRANDDGSYQTTDFTLQEIRQLRRSIDTGSDSVNPAAPVPPSLGIASLEETLALLRTIEHQQQRRIGIAPKLNAVSQYTKADKDVSRLLVAMLVTFGYDQDQPVMLQSNNGDELQRIKEELLPMYGLAVPLIQRIDTADDDTQSAISSVKKPDNSWIFTRLGLRMVSSYADGLLLPGSYIHKGLPSPLPPGFIDDAKTLGLDLFVTDTVSGSDQLPDFAASYDELLDYYYRELGVNGVLTTVPEKAVGYFQHQAQKEAEKLQQQAENQVLPLSVYLQRQAAAQEKIAQPESANL
ncbi:glycerophosphodiester phosphodiesterase family protein [Desulfosediminicola sp.]|uniref:glycerophosphodiester phosphodiesterase family protein n=1 Tax=Desulfosediminicola sp. TaxID=2886825 RepID=UPI003AF29607